ncbi:hypothetical protein BT67DRAFT_434085 [Trichocladium antarcticum]|uniref:Uncharacterized protein n=1 Tax=Trichocladium antarcticum TaxID=1450529 RepID=A0AAN6UKW5_9PEZI|nr:hypothetical protein BT67DRAFT_434085 [Trichocladium antarcticum]
MAFTGLDRTILGPLTTTFTPPAPCSVAIGWCRTCNVAWRGQTCAPDTVQDDTACWPATTEGAPEPSQMFFGRGFYSPGLLCPVGYSSACSATEGGKTGMKAQFLMEPGETFVGCCPTGFKCANLNGQTCIMAARSTTIQTVSCELGSSNNFGFTTLPNADVDTLNIFAPMIQLAWKSSDSLTTTESHSSTSTEPPQSSATTAHTSITPGANPPANPDTGSDPLSAGAIAGIGVAAAALFFLVLAAAIFVWRRRRHQRGALIPAGDGSSHDGSSTAYAPGGGGGGGGGGALQDLKQFQHYYAVNSASPGPVPELQGPPAVFEVPAQGHGRVEMEGAGMGPARAEMPGQGQMVAEMPTQRYR